MKPVKYKKSKSISRHTIFARIFVENYILKYGIGNEFIDLEDAYLMFLLGQNLAYRNRQIALQKRDRMLAKKTEIEIRRIRG